MNSPLLVIDSNNLCHRAFHALTGVRGGMSGSVADVSYSFLQTIGRLQKHFATDRFAFCFDHKVSYRREIFPDYKLKRKQAAMKEVEMRKSLNTQIRYLRHTYLPQLGFSNIFRSRGMESDDLMAAIALSRPDDEMILVTSDSDLLQCLRKNISIYSPHKKTMTTRNTFMETYGVYPKQWAKVKAMSGCPTDGIPGLLGVGETGALKYLRGELKETSSQYIWITCEKGQAMIQETLRLVKLPFAGCPVPEITDDSRIRWERLGRMRL